MPSSQPENQLDSDLDNILANLAWNGKYFDSGQEVVNAGEVIKAKEAIDRLVTEARIEELDRLFTTKRINGDQIINQTTFNYILDREAQLKNNTTKQEEE